jgi:hypothetical protein
MGEQIFRDENILVTFLGGDFGYANIEHASALLNWLILNHLVQKSDDKLPLLDNISSEIILLRQQILKDPPVFLKIFDI